MKLTAFLLLIVFLNLHAAGVSQSVTLSGREVNLKQAFTAIKKQTGYFVFYKQGLLDLPSTVSYSVSNMPVHDFLELLLKDQPIRFIIKDKNIFLTSKKEKVPPVLDPLVALLPFVTIAGQVTDENNVPVQGASISIVGSRMATSTAANGRFSLTGVPDNATIQISSIGYSRLSFQLSNGRLTVTDKALAGQLVSGDLNNISIRLKASESKLDEVRIIAYGSDTKRFSVGSVATVNAAELEKHPVSNVLLALQGQVPGMVVTTTSGAPGAAVKIQIRGQNTLYNGITNVKPYDQPLFIVDGVPMATQNNSINLLTGFGSTSGLSPFSTLNPSDIESVSVLKDADATSIYGSQGSNGVILITTKKGKEGKPQLELSTRTGIEIATKLVPMMNTQQYREMRLEAFANDGITTVQGPTAGAANYAPDLTLFDQDKNTDWFNYLMGNTSTNTNVYGNFSGGTSTTNFILSGGLSHQGYNFPGKLANNVYTFHSGFNYNSPDRRISVGVIADYGYQDNNSSSVSSLPRNIVTPPNYPDLIDENGELVWFYKGFSLANYQTYASLKRPGRTQSSNMKNLITLSYQILPGLKLMANVGYNRNNTNETQQTPLSSLAPGMGTSSAVFGSNNFQTFNAEPQLNYKNKFGKGELTVLLGGNYKKNVTNSSQIRGNNYVNDALLGSVSGATTITSTDGGNMYKYIGAFGRIGYIFDHKYIVSLTGRRDGSSNFGPGKKFGSFGSVGLGWIFTEEAGVNTSLPFLSFGKISGSYGSSGSDAVAPYRYQTFWGAAPGNSLFQGTRPYNPANLYNPNYSWDVKKTLNTAIDLGFLNDRILANVTWYQSRSGNQLINSNLPIMTGSSQVIENSPATVQNSGLEFSLNTTNIKTKNFTWSTSFNISRNRNQLLRFPDLSISAYARAYEIGKPISTSLAYRFKGVNPQTGVFEFYNKKGEATYLPGSADSELLIDLTPDFSGGLTNTLTFKNLSFSFMFHFSKGTNMNWLGSLYNQSVIPGQAMNLPVAALDRWRKPGDISTVQKLTNNYLALYDLSAQYFMLSTGPYTDGAYARLKMANLSYSLPATYLKKLSLKGLKFYASAENLFVISNFKVGDPETAGGLFSIPLQRTIVCGLSINL